MSSGSDIFINNIIEHSERLTAVIENTDFVNPSYNPNLTLIPSLWNNVSDALIAWAMLCTSNNSSECRKNAEAVLQKADLLSADAETWLNTMKNLRMVYISDFPEMEFNKNDCLTFLTAYDNFMYTFYTTSYSIQDVFYDQKKDYKCICSMKETFLKKFSKAAIPDKVSCSDKQSDKSTEHSTVSQERLNNTDTLLRQLIKETQRTNELLEKLLSRG